MDRGPERSGWPNANHAYKEGETLRAEARDQEQSREDVDTTGAYLVALEPA